MTGKKVLHYTILEKLGEGGMGVVYLAEDNKLKRRVAIKFLPGHITGNSEERRRFETEAQAAAALNHPNIATIYAIEESNDDIFLVMEYITGRHLKDHIKSKPLPVAEAVGIALQIARGLKAAHEKGIVHRDIKSANIMSTDNEQVKIMDFGLAKFRDSAQITKQGTTVGTAAYMSPEQARGEDADHRADIWSFGIVFYEMLTGHPPFKGDYEQAVIYNLLNEEITPASELNPEIPLEINAIISKCLEKNKEQRYQSISDVLADLQDAAGLQKNGSTVTDPVQFKRKSVGKNKLFVKRAAILAGVVIVLLIAWFYLMPGPDTTESVKKMLVVLPFENLGNTDDEYFADGITGEITSKLSGLSGLGVIARSSAMQYKNSAKTLRQIGAELGVQYVLEGTVQWERAVGGAKRVRVNPELIEIRNATQIWSKPYESNFSSVFELQANIAATVADALNLTLLKSEKKILEEKITQNPEAYDLYLRANKYAENIEDEQNSRIAEQLYLKAVSLDENFASAYAGLSTVQSNMYWEYYERSEENLKKSEANAKKALAINPDLPLAHIAMGDYYYHGRLEYQSALREYNQALTLQPNNVDASNGIGFVYRRQGKMREAITYFKKTFEFDPRNYTTVYSTGETYVLLREYENAIPYLHKASSIIPDSKTPFLELSLCYILMDGNIEQARITILNVMENKIGLDYNQFKYALYLYDIYERKFENARTHIEGIKELNEQFFYMPEALLDALSCRFSGEGVQAKLNFESAKQQLLQKIDTQPQDSRLYSALGLAYAGLGQKANAVREGQRAVELLPMDREAWRGSYRLLDLARIYAMVGEPALAIKTIEKLLASPTDALGVWLLKLDPSWDTLRNEQEFQRLLSHYSEKN